MKRFDLVIIGSGPGGYVAAIRAGTLGLKTALVEKDPFLGGTCLHRGCIPTKALLHTAHLYYEIKNASQLGIKAEPELDFPRVHARKKKVVRKLAKGIEFLMKKRKVEVLSGSAFLYDFNTVEIKSNKERETIRADHIIIATGSTPFHLPHIVPDGETVLSSDHILEIQELPKSLAVVGAGAVGVEFASIFSSFGSTVYLIELLPRVLPSEDEEISVALEKALGTRGIHIHTSNNVKAVEKTPPGAKLTVVSGENVTEIKAEKVLLSVGRKPSSGGLGLEDLGIVVENGTIKVNDFLQTSVPSIYAIGDVIATPQLAHVASAEGILAVEHIASKPVEPIDYRKIPSCTYSHPEVASIGLSEKDALDQGYQVKVGRFPFSASGKASILGEGEGLVKIVSEKSYDEVLGVHIIGPGATELIAEACIALRLETTVEDLFRTIHAHPTLSEAMMEAAHDVYGEAIHV